MTWFTNLEELAYSTVEYLPVLGTLYSLARTSIAHRENNWPTLWQSFANFMESSVRDIVIIGEIAEPVPAVIVHAMAESFTDKAIEIYHREPVVKVKAKLNKEDQHVIVAEPKHGSRTSQVFGGKAKGVFYFHHSVFFGILTHAEYAHDGVKIRLDIPYGLCDGAPVMFSWRWTKDESGTRNRPEATFGIIKLKETGEGNPTEFELSKHKGAGWEGYNFKGKVMSKDEIIAYSRMAGQDITIIFKRASEP